MEIQRQKTIYSSAKEYYEYCQKNGFVRGSIICSKDSKEFQIFVTNIAKKIGDNTDYIIVAQGHGKQVFRIKENQEIWYEIYETTENNL